MNVKNIVFAGCSFTCGAWSSYLAQNYFPSSKMINLSFPGVGNDFIADTLIKYLSSSQLDTETTLVFVMWSGTTRKDFLVSQEFFNTVSNNNGTYCKKFINGEHYIISGGISGAWQGSPEIRPIFDNFYKVTDYYSLANYSLSNMVKTKNYLENNNYKYKFLSYVNYWVDTPSIVSPNMDISLTYYGKNNPLLHQLGDQWIWADENKNCLYEFAKEHTMFIKEDKFHPNDAAHQQFVDKFIITDLKI
jgi:hypothetical protein